MTDLKLLYDSMYADAAPLIRAGACSADPHLDAPDDNRCGLTLLLRPPVKIQEAFRRFQEAALDASPGLYLHPASDLHVTVLAIVSCREGFRLDGIDVAAYERLVRACLEGIAPFVLRFRGITASAAAVMACGYPEGDALEQVRGRLRKAFRATSLDQSIDTRYVLQSAHATLLRFPEQPRNAPALARVLEQHRNTDFGCWRCGEMELVFNDWYQRANRVQRLASFRLERTRGGPG
ncbi:2'-5' RNA ligase family protein [Flaviaesturariibacter amylovorans]